MTVLIVNHYALTPEQSGGTRHYDIARELVQRGHDVTIVAAGRHYATYEDEKRYPDGEDFLIETVEGIRFVWVRTAPYRGNGIGRVRNMLEFTWKLRRLPKLGLPAPDVVVGSSVHLFAVYGAYRLAKRYRVPFVMEVRDIWPQTLIDMGISKRHPFVLLLGRLEPFLYRKADRIVTLLPKAAEHIESFGIAPQKIRWVSNGVDLSPYVHPGESHRLDPSKFNVLYAGSMGQANGLEVLIEAARRLSGISEIHVTLVGSGPHDAALRKQASPMPNVTILPPVKKEQVPALLAEADVLYVGLRDLPLYRFGMSMNKVFDYMAGGKPVVFAANVPENPVEKAKSGLIVASDDPDAIANALQTLYNYTPQERLAMGERAKRYVRTHFGMDVIASAFETVLKEAEYEYKKN